MNPRILEIEARKVEIRGILEAKDQTGVDLDALEKELRDLEVEKTSIEKREKIIAGLKDGTIEGRGIIPPAKKAEAEKRDFSALGRDKLLKDPEYRSGYLKQLQGKSLTETEQRALTTAVNSGGAAVPTTTLNLIVQRLQQTSVLFPRINVTYIPGNLSIAVANVKNAAAWKTEGTDGTPEDDTVVQVNLAGYELIKLVEISAASDAMSIDAFETYIAGEIGRQLSIAIENAILNGTGIGQPTGILSGITWSATNSATWPLASAIGYDDVLGVMGLLPTMYHPNACFVMNRSMLFNGIRKIKDDYKQPIFVQNPLADQPLTILGYPVIVDDYMPDDTLLFCDHSYYYLNFSKSPEISSDRSASFKSGKIVYRGLAVLDGKPALAEAFTKLSKATA